MMYKISMFRIKEVEQKIKVPCEFCFSKGIVYHKCSKCGGNGVHNKTIKIWKVAKYTEDIIAIDRDNKCELRYWTSQSEYFPEDSKLVHFTKKDAEAECARRNEELSSVIDIMNRNTFGL